MKVVTSLLFCGVFVVAVALANAIPTHIKINAELDEHWLNYKKAYGKQYDSQFEIVRRMIWEKNLRRIQEHNMEYDLGHHTYTLGMNEHGDLTNAEFRAMHLGTKMRSRNNTGGSTFIPPMNVKAPETVDWRDKGLVTGVKNQGRCGSCWSFSTTGSLEGQYARKTGKLVSFSEQQLVDCSGSYGNQGCNGGLMDSAFTYLEKYGIERESDYPYKAEDERCHFDSSRTVTKVTGFTDVKTGDEEDLQKAVATVGPVSVAIDASHFSFQFYKHGVYNERKCSSHMLDHGVLVVGYGTDGDEGYWLVKNSWGNRWGIQGYIKMSRNRGNQCGIATQASYPLL